MHQPELKIQFAELNIRHRGNPERTLTIVRRAIRMGYDAVAINLDIGKFGAESYTMQLDGEEDTLPKKKRKKQKQQQKRKSDAIDSKAEEDDIVPDPFLVDESKLDLSTFSQNGRRFRQFSRLTVSIDADSIHRLQHNKKVKLYDIVAVRVPDEQILMTLQRKGDFIDLISLDSVAMEKGRLSWLFKQKIVQSCIAAGLTFELCYGHALVSSEHRRQFFANARRLMEITRMGRVGVVLSSGAEEMLQLRGPFDVANLCSLFGLAPKFGRRFVTSNALSVLLRSQTRRHTVKGAIHVADLEFPLQTASACTKTFVPEKNVIEQLAGIEEFSKEMRVKMGGEKCKLATEEREQQNGKDGEMVGNNDNSLRRRKRRTEEVDKGLANSRHRSSLAPMELDENIFEIFT